MTVGAERTLADVRHVVGGVQAVQGCVAALVEVHERAVDAGRQHLLGANLGLGNQLVDGFDTTLLSSEIESNRIKIVSNSQTYHKYHMYVCVRARMSAWMCVCMYVPYISTTLWVRDWPVYM